MSGEKGGQDSLLYALRAIDSYVHALIYLITDYGKQLPGSERYCRQDHQDGTNKTQDARAALRATHAVLS